MAMSLSNAMESDKLANRVVHISVQLFSNEDLAFKMTQSMQLIHVLICSVTSLVKKSLIDNPMTGKLAICVVNILLTYWSASCITALTTRLKRCLHTIHSLARTSASSTVHSILLMSF